MPYFGHQDDTELDDSGLLTNDESSKCHTLIVDVGKGLLEDRFNEMFSI